MVDDEDYERINKHKWYVYNPNRQAGEYWYAVRSKKIGGKSCKVSMAHEIMYALPGEHIDHSNHNTLDNRLENLRRCTHGQNMQNRKLHKNNTSGYKGVQRNGRKGSGKWRVRIKCNNKQISLGYYFSAIEAAQAYDRVATILFGEFACLNFSKIV